MFDPTLEPILLDELISDRPIMAIGYWLSDTVFDNTYDCTSMAVNSSASTDVVLNKKSNTNKRFKDI